MVQNIEPGHLIEFVELLRKKLKSRTASGDSIAEEYGTYLKMAKRLAPRDLMLGRLERPEDKSFFFDAQKFAWLGKQLATLEMRLRQLFPSGEEGLSLPIKANLRKQSATDHGIDPPRGHSATISGKVNSTTSPVGQTIFIGHGRSRLWQQLVLALEKKHGYETEAFETGPRAGYSTIEVLDEVLNRAGIAILVMTAEDQDPLGKLHARENVIHEVGLFQGRIGFKRVMVLLEQGCGEFSNIVGLHRFGLEQATSTKLSGRYLRRFDENTSDLVDRIPTMLRLKV